MDARTGTLEDLPPLELTALRDLDLREPPQEGRPAHVSSASGVVRRGDHVYVIGDDLLSLAVYRLSRPEPGTLERVLEGELPVDEDQRKADKPDLEALTVLPPFDEHPFGVLFGLGSGSGPGRDRGFVWALQADGSLRDRAAEVDLSPVYERLRSEVGALNVEGACVVGGCLWLLNRGNDPDSRNAVAELPLDEVMTSLHGDLRLDASELSAIRSYDLGELDGVPLAFSDGTPLATDVLVFTASAEADDDDGPDGEIRGSVLGTIGPDGDVRRLRTIDRRYKVEGVHATIDTGVVDLLLVCDQDDPEVVSPLLSASMPLDAGHEPPR